MHAQTYRQACRTTEDGYEGTWAVNVVAPFHLSHALRPIIADRIVNVSSISAARSLDWSNLFHERGYSGHTAYATSKAAVQMFTVSLAERRGAEPWATVCLDPGTVNTKMLLAGWGRCGIKVRSTLLGSSTWLRLPS